MIKALLSLGFALWIFQPRALANFQKGDLVFLSMPCQSCQLIEETTRSPFSLVGILDPNGQGHWNVIMAGEPAVGMVPLSLLVEHALRPPVFKRMKTPQGQIWAEKAAEVARGFTGTPYNPDFTWGTQKLYCSELVYFSFWIASGRKASPFEIHAMRFGPYANQWADLLGHAPPEGQPGLSPQDISESSYLEVIP